MHRSKSPRRTLVALGLAALLLAPLPVRAGDGTAPPTDSSMLGVCFAVICGASVSIARAIPVPIVAATAGIACLAMLADAMATPDAP
jgi:hypothetical protein